MNGFRPIHKVGELAYHKRYQSWVKLRAYTLSDTGILYAEARFVLAIFRDNNVSFRPYELATKAEALILDIKRRSLNSGDPTEAQYH